MIEIQNLREFNFEQVVDLLLEQKTQPFDIYVPKSTVLFNSDREAIAMDYAGLAYSGHLLFTVADSFEYEEVQPHEHESVLFSIKAKDIEKLASALLLISYGYVNDHPEDEDYNLAEQASNYFYEIETGEISNIACPYFVEISKEFEQEEEESQL